MGYHLGILIILTVLIVSTLEFNALLDKITSEEFHGNRNFRIKSQGSPSLSYVSIQENQITETCREVLYHLPYLGRLDEKFYFLQNFGAIEKQQIVDVCPTASLEDYHSDQSIIKSEIFQDEKWVEDHQIVDLVFHGIDSARFHELTSLSNLQAQINQIDGCVGNHGRCIVNGDSIEKPVDIAIGDEFCVVIRSAPMASLSTLSDVMKGGYGGFYFISSVSEYKMMNHYSVQLGQTGEVVVTTGGEFDNSSILLWANGLMGEGGVIGLGDSGLDTSDCMFYDNSTALLFDDTYLTRDLYEDPTHRKVVQYFGLKI